LSRDQKFFDMYSLVIGVLAAIALAILVLAMKMSDLTQGVYTRDTAEYKAAVDERIRPVGQVYLPGDAVASQAPTVETAAEPEPVATAMTGPQVYNAACIACHGTGVAGAPMVGNADQWADRIAQGADLVPKVILELVDVGDVNRLSPEQVGAPLRDALFQQIVCRIHLFRLLAVPHSIQ